MRTSSHNNTLRLLSCLTFLGVIQQQVPCVYGGFIVPTTKPEGDFAVIPELVRPQPFMFSIVQTRSSLVTRDLFNKQQKPSFTRRSRSTYMQQGDDSQKKRSFFSWTAFKESFYSSVDAVSSLPFLSKDKNQSMKTKLRKGIVEGGYGDRVETPFPGVASSKINKKTGGRDSDLLVRQYKAMQREKQVASLKPLPPDKKLSKAQYYFADIEPSTPTPPSLFDSFKESIYSTADSFSDPNKKSPKTTAPSTSSFKPAFKPSNSDDISKQIQALIPELASPNPFVRWTAQWRIDRLEQDKLERERALARDAAFERVKTMIYETIDSINRISEQISAIPEILAEQAQQIQKFADDSYQGFQATIKEIEATPAKIKQSSENIETSFQNAKKISEVVAQDIYNIPSTVQNTINETTAAVNNQIESTKKTVVDIKQIPKKVKVMTGLEKLPTPPPPPPPPKTDQEIALEIGGEVAKGVLFVGKSAVGLGVEGVKAVIKSAEEKKKIQKGEIKDPSKVRAGRYVTKRTVALERKPGDKPDIVKKVSVVDKTVGALADIYPGLGKEIAEAISLADTVPKKPAKKTEVKKEEKKNAVVAEAKEEKTKESIYNVFTKKVEKEEKVENKEDEILAGNKEKTEDEEAKKENDVVSEAKEETEEGSSYPPETEPPEVLNASTTIVAQDEKADAKDKSSGQPVPDNAALVEEILAKIRAEEIEKRKKEMAEEQKKDDNEKKKIQKKIVTEGLSNLDLVSKAPKILKISKPKKRVPLTSNTPLISSKRKSQTPVEIVEMNTVTPIKKRSRFKRGIQKIFSVFKIRRNKKSRRSIRSSGPDIDIQDALTRAMAAAEKASADVAEMEYMIQKTYSEVNR